MQIRSGGTCNWSLKGGARLIEVAATAGGTVCDLGNNKRTDQIVVDEQANLHLVVCTCTKQVFSRQCSFVTCTIVKIL